MKFTLILSFAALFLLGSCDDNSEPSPQTSTPPAPTNGQVDDEADIFTYTLANGFNLAEHEQTLDGGATWSTATNPIIVGKVDKGLNQVGVRVKSANGRNNSTTLSNEVVFTSNTTVAPKNGIVNDTTNTFDYTLALGYSLADHEQTIDGGNTWAAATKPIVVPNNVIAINKIGIRVKAAQGRNASQILYNQQPFSVSITRRDLVINKAWRITSITEAFMSSAPNDVFSSRPSCEKDDEYFFSLPDVATFDQGPTKCNPSDPQSNIVNWSLYNNDTRFNTTVNSIIIFDGEILRLTTNRLVIKELDRGTTRIYTFTY